MGRFMNEDSEQRLHIFVHGRVQGVGFRHFVLSRASEWGISGWVRNRRDGSVEVTAEGKKEQLEDLLQILQRGPASANVTGVEPEWDQATGEFYGFKVKMTY